MENIYVEYGRRSRVMINLAIVDVNISKIIKGQYSIHTSARWLMSGLGKSNTLFFIMLTESVFKLNDKKVFRNDLVIHAC